MHNFQGLKSQDKELRKKIRAYSSTQLSGQLLLLNQLLILLAFKLKATDKIDTYSLCTGTKVMLKLSFGQ